VAVLEHDERLGFGEPIGVLVPDHGRLEHSPVTDEGVLDLDRGDPDAADLEHVVGAMQADEGAENEQAGSEARDGVGEAVEAVEQADPGLDGDLERQRRQRLLAGRGQGGQALYDDGRGIFGPAQQDTVRDGVEAKQCVGPDGAETFVLVRSIERREKEQALRAHFCRRIEARLARLDRRLRRARRPLDARRLERQLGRMLALNARAAGRYVIEFVADASLPAGLRLQWTARPAWDDWARWSEGCYVLRSNIADWSPEELWRTYIQLAEAEAKKVQTTNGGVAGAKVTPNDTASDRARLPCGDAIGPQGARA
jgi:hypothetical protein